MPPSFRQLAPRVCVAAVFSALSSLAAASPATEPPQTSTLMIGQWTVITRSSVIAQSLAAESDALARIADASELASRMQRVAIDGAGVISVETLVDAEAKTMSLDIVKASINADGAFGRIFAPLDGAPVTKEGLEAKTRIAQEAARYNNESLSIKINNGEEAGSPMSVSVRSEAVLERSWGGNLTVSNYGQRYSGRDLATLSGYARLGHETQAQLALTTGLSGAREDSKGGFYRSGSLTLDHVFSMSIGSLRLSDTRYKQGGALRAYDQRGRIQRFDLELKVPLSAASTATYGGGFIRQETAFGAAGLTERASLSFVSVGYAYAAGPLSWNAKLTQGLSSSRSFNVAPLTGEMAPRFTALPVEARYGFDLDGGWALDLSGSAQIGSKGTPSSMQFYAGGPDRGRAFNTGNIAGPAGAAASAMMSKGLDNGFTIYAGLDAARVKQVVGPTLSQSSMFAGLTGGLGARARFDIGLAKPIATPPGVSKKPQVSLMLNIGF